MKDRKQGAFIVSWDFSHGEKDVDKDILLVGQQFDGVMELVNVFQGQEALDIYDKLVHKKVVKTDA